MTVQKAVPIEVTKALDFLIFCVKDFTFSWVVIMEDADHYVHLSFSFALYFYFSLLAMLPYNGLLEIF